MSYSRWITSHWYTYWLANDGLSRDEQYFDICSVKLFSYKELKEDLTGCLDKVKELDPGATKQDIDELKGYILAFLEDVEHDVDIKNYDRLKQGDLSNFQELLDWSVERSKSLRNIQLRESIDEALKIICADDHDLPMLMVDVKTELGKILLEKRFNGTLKTPI